MLGEAGFTVVIDKPPALGIQVSHRQATSVVRAPPQAHLLRKDRATSLHTALSMSLLCSETLSCLLDKVQTSENGLQGLALPSPTALSFSFLLAVLPSAQGRCSPGPRLVLEGCALDLCC